MKKVTIKDIAKIAGVSHSTVSRSLNDSPHVSEKTKRLIKRIARDLNFEFNANARSLSTNRTGTIGVICPEIFERFGSFYYMELLMRSVRQSLEKASMDTIITFARNSYTGESNIQKLVNRRKIDGLLLIHPNISSEDWQFINLRRIPYVVLHFKPQNVSYNDMHYIFVDHEYGGFLATEHLMRDGRRNILCINEDSSELQFIERMAGYKQALAEHDIPVVNRNILYGSCTYEFGYQTIMDHRGIISDIDGIFAEADIMAIGAIAALLDMGVKVPDDVAVVGYDDIEFGRIFRPSLTTVHQPRERLVSDACERLVRLVEGDSLPLLQEMIKPELIIRESCGVNRRN
ncbi:LacI family DNA-binding transcriptional regulator [Marispirochaeta sp.]|jgi:LacI family transcriptional regulator|uniref:LacI family DNA-binding transcriptional regulator n=1 Tax=Marispirochaeta sp. TaxID=2038653 RepID=UPI0029C9059B|nr:LacI family DNA-binding transcriptional regulator [Marispirochaeta sp.]